MEANNSMINPDLNESNQTFKDSGTEENSNISMTLSKTKMKEKTKTPKGKKFKIECANNNVLNMHILSTLMNEKKSLIVTPANSGETSFAIIMKNKKPSPKHKTIKQNCNNSQI